MSGTVTPTQVLAALHLTGANESAANTILSGSHLTVRAGDPLVRLKEIVNSATFNWLTGPRCATARRRQGCRARAACAPARHSRHS